MQWIFVLAVLGIASWVVYRQILGVFRGEGCGSCSACGGCCGAVHRKGTPSRGGNAKDGKSDN